jgi:tetratricopeptide (TPR) repeat protein
MPLARIQRSIGEALRAQGDFAGALAADREALRIMSELTAKAPAQAPWQRDLAVNHGKAGLDLLSVGDAGDARDEIQAGLTIMTPLAALDTTNAGWQQDLGELQRANGDASKAASDDAGAREEWSRRHRLHATDPRSHASHHKRDVPGLTPCPGKAADAAGAPPI